MKLKAWKQKSMIGLLVLSIVLCTIGGYAWWVMIQMPGKSHRGSLPTADSQILALEAALRKDVEKLAGEIGERNISNRRHPALAAAADFLEASFAKAGYKVQRQGYEIARPEQGRRDKIICHNLEVEITGLERKDEIVIIGGHYDSVIGSPGANDNGSGAVAVIALARVFAEKKCARTLRFVEFVNEEPPYFQTLAMGSVVYAKRCRERNEKIVAMLSLETIGYYSDQEGSQTYPPLFKSFYPSTGNFIGFVGNLSSKALVQDVTASFRRHTKFPSESVATFDTLPGVGWSDHWAFWQEGYSGVMVTDTAPFRYPYYHSQEDTPDKLDYDRMARVVAGLEKVVAELASLKTNRPLSSR